MDHSNQISQQNIPRKRGRRKEVELHNIPIFPPHDSVLQFTLTGGKKNVIHVVHQQCQALTNQNSITENNTMNFYQAIGNHATVVEIRYPLCKQFVTNNNVCQQPRHPLTPITIKGNGNVEDITLYHNIHSNSNNVVSLKYQLLMMLLLQIICIKV